jgi:hypothetical protein
MAAAIIYSKPLHISEFLKIELDSHSISKYGISKGDISKSPVEESEDEIRRR